MAEFEIGELVNIEINNVRICAARTPSGRDTLPEGFAIVDNAGFVYNLPPQATITRVTPEQWPPQPNDLWGNSQGTRWWAVKGNFLGTGQPGIGLMNEDGDWSGADSVQQRHGPLHLVHRAEPGGGGTR